jgi:hypothetical protein
MDTHRKFVSPILDELSDLEPIFHRPEHGTTRADFERMTRPDFWEIGASGQTYNRETVLNVLSLRDQPEQDIWETDNFAVQQLAADLYLLNYELLQNNIRLTRRTTLWLRTADGWQAMFHQGTIIQEIAPSLPPQTPTEIERLAQAWIALYCTDRGTDEHNSRFWVFSLVYDLQDDAPETVWQFILAVQRLDRRIAQKLSAGPIEDLLVRHGAAFIDRVEDEARRDPAFAFTLGGVWQNRMTDEVWSRIQAVATYAGWDGNPDEPTPNDPDTLKP